MSSSHHSHKIKLKVESQCGQARATQFTLPHQGEGPEHVVTTPTFMPVGTLATVKSLMPSDLEQMQAQIVLGNTYHLYLRPGSERVARLGGLHKFMNWHGPILTDSGGFQVFSLGDINKVDDDGVTFRSHLDGSQHRMTPEISMKIQRDLGSNIVMAFDQCPALPSGRDEIKKAVDRTTDWARRGMATELQPYQTRFGIFQGGLDLELRRESLEQLMELPFDGYAIGGLSVGESPEQMHRTTREIAPWMPAEKPRYLMGVGRPQDLVEGVAAGVDIFDCVMPSRNARNGQLFTSQGKINIKNATWADDDSPLDPECACPTCTQFTKAYLRHLFVCGEMLSARLNTLHNLWYYLDLMRQMRSAILQNEFDEWRANFYRGGYTQ